MSKFDFSVKTQLKSHYLNQFKLSFSNWVKPRFSKFTFKKSWLEIYTVKSRLKSLQITKRRFTRFKHGLFFCEWIFAAILPLKSQLSWKCKIVSTLLMKVLKCWKIGEFPKISIKKLETFYGVKTASCLEKIIQPQHTI